MIDYRDLHKRLIHQWSICWQIPPHFLTCKINFRQYYRIVAPVKVASRCTAESSPRLWLYQLQVADVTRGKVAVAFTRTTWL